VAASPSKPITRGFWARLTGGVKRPTMNMMRMSPKNVCFFIFPSFVDKNTGMVEKTGMMEEWNAGILGKKESVSQPLFSL
jgi:hypothetical protein